MLSAEVVSPFPPQRLVGASDSGGGWGSGLVGKRRHREAGVHVCELIGRREKEWKWWEWKEIWGGRWNRDDWGELVGGW